jgi:hypothetical protein
VGAAIDGEDGGAFHAHEALFGVAVNVSEGHGAAWGQGYLDLNEGNIGFEPIA